MIDVEKELGLKHDENIGIWWVGHELRTPAGRKIKGKIWWGVCKKTRKVAFAAIASDTIHAMAPMIIQSTDITNGRCFDARSCLNIDCPYAECKTLIDAVHKTNFKDINTDENLINFFEKSFKSIQNYFEGMDSKEILEHFNENYGRTTITEAALETRLPK